MTAALAASARGTEAGLRIRAAHVVGSLSQEASGPSYTVPRLCDALLEAGVGVDLLTVDFGPVPCAPDYSKSFPLGSGPGRLVRSPAMRQWLDREAARGRVQVLHMHGLWQMPYVYPAWTARAHGTPLVASPRGSLSAWALASGSKAKKLFWPLFQKPALEAAACFHATSDSEYEDVRRAGFRQPVIILPNGIDAMPLAQRSPQLLRTLLYLGRIHEKKGIDLLLAAWAAVQARHTQWAIKIVGSDQSLYGSSGLSQRLKAMAADLKLERVTFEDAIFGEEKFAAYRNADLFILPTRSENFGMTVAEALSQETPAIVTKEAPWAGLSEKGCGWWVDLSVDTIAEAMDEAMSLPEDTLNAMGAKGRAWLLDSFQWPILGERMAQAYRWLLDRRGDPPPFIRLH
jgi:glycosyltransferase involved in cell wall biosynthesis